jgi:hypothetical protein
MSGDPQVRFGGRGHRNQSVLPTPILLHRTARCDVLVPKQSARAKLYKITEPDLEIIPAASNGRCSICGKAAALVIDHDHAPEANGRVRGAICDRCNRGLAAFAIPLIAC